MGVAANLESTERERCMSVGCAYVPCTAERQTMARFLTLNRAVMSMSGGGTIHTQLKRHEQQALWPARECKIDVASGWRRRRRSCRHLKYVLERVLDPRAVKRVGENHYKAYVGHSNTREFLKLICATLAAFGYAHTEELRSERGAVIQFVKKTSVSTWLKKA